MGPAPLRVTHCPVNFAGMGWTNVEALRRQGVEARLVVFEAHPAHPEADLDLRRPASAPLWRRQLVQFRALARLLPVTDIFHFYFGLTLVPQRIQFPILHATGKKSVFHFVGSDIRGKTPEQLAYGRRANAQIVGSCDAARWVPEAQLVPPGIDLARITPAARRDGPVRVVHAALNRSRKGTDQVAAACARLGVELDIVEGVHHTEVGPRIARADIVVDQLITGWYGLFAIEAMANGKPVLGYIHEEAAEKTKRAFGLEVPIVRTTAETLADDLRPLVESAEARALAGEASRAYVEHVHDADKLAGRLIEIYASL